MESASLVVQRLSTLSGTLFTGAESAEVFGCLWGLLEKTQDDAALVATFDFDVKEDLMFDRLAFDHVYAVQLSIMDFC